MKVDAHATDRIEYLDPRTHRPSGTLAVPGAGSLRGQWVGYLDNGWKSFTRMSGLIEQALVRELGIAGFRRYSIPTSLATPPALLDEVARDCKAAIVGLAN